MANDLSTRQWHLDTPLAFSTGAGAVLWPINFKCLHMEFSNYTAQGQQAVIKDRNGKIVWSATGTADLQEVRSAKIGWVNGLVLDTLQGGFVTIFVE
jgi:hypothetical protein